LTTATISEQRPHVELTTHGLTNTLPTRIPIQQTNLGADPTQVLVRTTVVYIQEALGKPHWKSRISLYGAEEDSTALSEPFTHPIFDDNLGKLAKSI